ncbi:hypothetical protein B484DRAFT_399151 [Ochromonadaceae sp. CCMP2298]|nr:hypothetical protein B484DRAFT_399151 [Ochromonadaceae sp. CCMP2298]
MLQHRLVLKMAASLIFLPHVQQAEKTLRHIGDWKVLKDKNESVKKELLLDLKMVEMLEHVIGYGPAHTGMAFNPMLEHLAYKLQGIKLLAKVQVGLWKGLLDWDDSELVADQLGDATDKALQVTEARLKKQLDDVKAIRAQRLGPRPAASSPPPTARVTEKRGRS